MVPGFCTSDADPELFFPIGNAGPALLQLDQAKQVWGAQSVRRAWSGPWPAARRPAYGEAPVSLSGARSTTHAPYACGRGIDMTATIS